LRDLVAESLRCELESDELDKLPLPPSRAVLFELLCIVRIAKHISPSPGDIRWMDAEVSRNTIVVPGARFRYQLVLAPHELSSTLVEPGLREAVKQFGVRLPERVDVLCEFTGNRRVTGTLAGILVEAKSGAQEPWSGLEQLRVYRPALAHRRPGRLLVWGISEQASQGSLDDSQLAWIREAKRKQQGDVWVFSTAEDIPRVLSAIGS